jgi:cytochrome P450
VSSNAERHTSVWEVCAMLGVPEQDRYQMAQWKAELGEHRRHDALDAYVDVMVADRCAHLRNDLLSELIRTGVAGLDLTADEIRLAVAAMFALAVKAESTTPKS